MVTELLFHDFARQPLHRKYPYYWDGVFRSTQPILTLLARLKQVRISLSRLGFGTNQQSNQHLRHNSLSSRKARRYFVVRRYLYSSTGKTDVLLLLDGGGRVLLVLLSRSSEKKKSEPCVPPPKKNIPFQNHARQPFTLPPKRGEEGFYLVGSRFLLF